MFAQFSDTESSVPAMPPQMLKGFVLSYGEAMRKKLLKKPRTDRFPGGRHHLHNLVRIVGVGWHGGAPFVKDGLGGIVGSLS